MELLELNNYQIISAVYCVVFLLTFALNSSVIVIFFGNPSLLTASNFLLLSMAVSDWMMAVLANTVGAYATANYWWTMDFAICRYFGFISTFCALTAMVHLTALSVERLVTVKTTNEQLSSKRKMGVVVAALWLFSFAWSLFPLIGWCSYGPEPGFAGCSITWHSSKPSDKAYIVCLFIFFFFVPIIIMTFCYISVYKEVKKLSSNAAVMWGNGAPPTRQTLRAKEKSIRMSVVMVLAYLVAWTPYAIVSLYSSFVANDIPPLLTIMPAFFAKFSSCYNPLIYFFTYSKFRKAAKKMFTKYLVNTDLRTAQILRVKRAVIAPT